ncbi:enoyl-CoA hydratase/isomerase family protein [Pseudomonadota bacterium]
MLEIIEHGNVREIKLTRPPANALSSDLVEKLTDALAAAGQEAGAVVVSGLPGMFSAGLDVPQLMQFDRSDISHFWQIFLKMLKTIAYLPVPTAFAMTGHAPAGGIVMALFGDYRIMPRGSFKTGLNEVQVGLVVSAPIHRALVRAVGPHTAERMLVAGELMESEKALAIGLIDELVDDPGQAVTRAIEWCEQHLALPKLAMSTTRQMARADLHQFFDDKSELGVEKFVDIWFSDETRATLTALVERLSGK